MLKWKNMSLLEQANKIIMQAWHTDDDITELHKIKWQLSLLYNDYSSYAWNRETAYNKKRADAYSHYKKLAKLKGEKYSDKTIEVMAKKQAEDDFGDYREMSWNAKWMYAIIETINSFCIDYYTRQKRIMESAR